jgi:hypothetical protein
MSYDCGRQFHLARNSARYQSLPPPSARLFIPLRRCISLNNARCYAALESIATAAILHFYPATRLLSLESRMSDNCRFIYNGLAPPPSHLRLFTFSVIELSIRVRAYDYDNPTASRSNYNIICNAIRAR